MEHSGRFAGWPDVRAYLEASYADLTVLAEEAVQVSVPVTSGHKAVTVRRVSVGGEAWLELVSEIGSARYVPPVTALARSFSMAMGALCVTQGSLALRQLLPAADLAVAALAETIGTIAQQAADGASSSGGGAGA